MTTRAEFEPLKHLGVQHSGIAVERMTVPVLQFLAAIVLAIAAFFAATAGARAGQSPVPTPLFVSPSEARAGSLLLKTEDGATPTRRGSAPISTLLSVVRPSVPRSPRSFTIHRRVGLRRSTSTRCRMAARRHPQDGYRRSHCRCRHQGAAAGARDVRRSETQRPESRADGTGAAKHFYQLDCQYRPR